VNNTTDNRNVSLGVDYGAYPQAKTFLFGLNLSL
jgi:TonB-dependent starch-binding outer membrane protein SusC